MHSCHFAKSFIERRSGTFCSGRACCCFVGCIATGCASFATAISTRFWHMELSQVRLRVRPSDSTSTRRRRDGCFFFRTFLVLFVEASVFCFTRVFIAYYRVSCYLFVRFCGSAFWVSPVTCLLGLRGMYHRLCDGVWFIFFLLSLYFLLALSLWSRIVWDTCTKCNGYLC